MAKSKIKFGRAAEPLPPRSEDTIAPADYENMLARWGYSKERFARFLGVSDRTGRTFAQDGPWVAVAKFMIYMKAKGDTPADADKIINKSWK